MAEEIEVSQIYGSIQISEYLRRQEQRWEFKKFAFSLGFLFSYNNHRPSTNDRWEFKLLMMMMTMSSGRKLHKRLLSLSLASGWDDKRL